MKPCTAFTTLSFVLRKTTAEEPHAARETTKQIFFPKMFKIRLKKRIFQDIIWAGGEN